jgi:hypothetical protein
MFVFSNLFKVMEIYEIYTKTERKNCLCNIRVLSGAICVWQSASLQKNVMHQHYLCVRWERVVIQISSKSLCKMPLEMLRVATFLTVFI